MEPRNVVLLAIGFCVMLGATILWTFWLEKEPKYRKYVFAIGFIFALFYLLLGIFT